MISSVAKSPPEAAHPSICKSDATGQIPHNWINVHERVGARTSLSDLQPVIHITCDRSILQATSTVMVGRQTACFLERSSMKIRSKVRRIALAAGGADVLAAGRAIVMPGTASAAIGTGHIGL